MIMSEGEVALFAWFTDEAFDVFEPPAPALSAFWQAASIVGGVCFLTRWQSPMMDRSASRPIDHRQQERTGALIPATPKMRLNFPGSKRVWICTCSMRSLKQVLDKTLSLPFRPPKQEVADQSSDRHHSA